MSNNLKETIKKIIDDNDIKEFNMSSIEKFIHPIGIETIELPSQEILITFKVSQKEIKDVEMPACLMGKKLS